MRLHVPCTDEELSGCTKVWQVTARCAADSNVEKEQKENKYWTLVHQVETNECLSVSAGCVNTQLFANTFAMSMLFLLLKKAEIYAGFKLLCGSSECLPF